MSSLLCRVIFCLSQQKFTLKRLPKKSDTLKRLQNQRVTLKRLHRKKVTPLNDLIFGEFLLNDKNAPVFEPVIKWQSSKNGLNTGYFDTFKKCELLSIALMISKSSLYYGYNLTPLKRFAEKSDTNDETIYSKKWHPETITRKKWHLACIVFIN